MAELYFIKSPKPTIRDEISPSPKPYKSSSSPVHDDYHTPRNNAEMYHLKTVTNDDEDMDHRASPAIIGHHTPPPRRMSEMYHVRTPNYDEENIDPRASPAVYNHDNSRRSPMPLNDSFGHRPEMYYLKASDGNEPVIGRQSPSSPDKSHRRILDETSSHLNNDSQQITMYLLTTSNKDDRENSAPTQSVRRSPSPLLHPSKKQPAVAYDNLSYLPSKKGPLTSVLREAPANVTHAPNLHSKASESIQRSMDKYRFGGS